MTSQPLNAANTNHCSDFSKLKEVFFDAEAALKIVEIDLQHGLVLPPLNEIRYASYHLVKALNYKENDDLINYSEQIDKAIKHCKRAIYDAYEIPVIQYRALLEEYHDQYDIRILSEVFDDYPAKRNQIREISKTLSGVIIDRGDKDSEQDNRNEYSDKCSSARLELKCLVEEFEDVESELRTLTDERNKDKKREIEKMYWLRAVGTAAIFGIMQIIVSLINKAS